MDARIVTLALPVAFASACATSHEPAKAPERPQAVQTELAGEVPEIAAAPRLHALWSTRANGTRRIAPKSPVLSETAPIETDAPTAHAQR